VKLLAEALMILDKVLTEALEDLETYLECELDFLARAVMAVPKFTDKQLKLRDRRYARRVARAIRLFLGEEIRRARRPARGGEPRPDGERVLFGVPDSNGSGEVKPPQTP